MIEGRCLYRPELNGLEVFAMKRLLLCSLSVSNGGLIYGGPDAAEKGDAEVQNGLSAGA